MLNENSIIFGDSYDKFCLNNAYYDFHCGADLSYFIHKLKLTNNGIRSSNLSRSFLTLSFYHLLSAIQYYLSGYELKINSKYHLQPNILQYYSIFYSMLGLLESQFKGIINVDGENGRRKIFITNDKTHEYSIKLPPGKAQHQVIANWFFAVLNKWQTLKCYDYLVIFKDDPGYFSSFRNWENYSTELLLEELHYNDKPQCPDLRDIEEYVNGNIPKNFDDCYPEDFWIWSFILSLADIHGKIFKLIRGNKKAVPISIFEKFLLFYKKTKYETLITSVCQEYFL